MGTPGSYKHAVHVPWYHVDEWHIVYDQLYGETATRETMTKAYNILTSWKTRTPRLYSGAEGTLIILQGMFDSENVDLKKNRMVIASAVMRFLNVCLSSNKKNQETFFQIAKNNDLPDWIIELRHDYTHSQKLPSQEMLERALKFLFNRLKTKYWDPQILTLDDLVIERIYKDDLKNLIDLYSRIALADEHHYMVTTKLKNRLKKYKVGINKSKHVMLEGIAEVLKSHKAIKILEIPDEIIQNGSIFKFEDDTDSKIFILSWLPIIQLLSNSNCLLQLIRSIIETCYKNHEEKTSTKAAIWLRDLCNLHLEGHEIFSPNVNIKPTLRGFGDWAVSKRSSYSHVYIRQLLALCEFNKDYIDSVYLAMEALVPKLTTVVPSQAYTMAHIKEYMKTMHIPEDYFQFEQPSCKRFKRIEVSESLMLRDLPLGQAPFDMNEEFKTTNLI